jgi:orotate phosphoribosyltransferase
MTAIDALRAKGHKIHSVVTVVDRLAGAAENLAKEGITLASLYTKDDFAT